MAADATLAASLVRVENAPAAYHVNMIHFPWDLTFEVAVSNVPAAKEVAVSNAPATTDVAVSKTPSRTEVASFTNEPRSSRFSSGAGLAATILDTESNSTIDESVIFMMSEDRLIMSMKVAIEGI